MERPLFVSLAWGLASGTAPTAAAVGVFFELLWLDLFPAGTFLPPLASLSTLCVVITAQALGQTDPASLALTICLAIPLANLGARAEAAMRQLHNADYNTLLGWSRRANGQDFHPGALVGRALARLGVMYAALYLVSATALFGLVAMLQPLVPSDARLSLNWGHLWLIASLGAILSLRLRRAYATLGATLLLLGLAILAGLKP